MNQKIYVSKAVQTIQDNGSVAGRELIPSQPKRPSFHPAGAPGSQNDARFALTGCSTPPNDRRFTLWCSANRPRDRRFAVWSSAKPQNDRHFTLPGGSMPQNDRHFAPPACREGKTTVAPGWRAAFPGKKSIFQARFIQAMGLTGLKTGSRRQEAVCHF